MPIQVDIMSGSPHSRESRLIRFVMNHSFGLCANPQIATYVVIVFVGLSFIATALSLRSNMRTEEAVIEGDIGNEVIRSETEPPRLQYPVE